MPYLNDDEEDFQPYCCDIPPHGHCVECEGVFEDKHDYFHFEDDRSGKAICKRCFLWVAEKTKWAIHPVEAKINTILSIEALTSGTRRKIGPELRQSIFDRDGYQCLICRTPYDLQIDHVLPVAHGGTDAYNNLQTLCRACNGAKGTQFYDARKVAAYMDGE